MNKKFAKKSNSNIKKKEKEKPFEKEITLKIDTTQILEHNQRSKRLKVHAILEDGSRYPLHYKIINSN